MTRGVDAVPLPHAETLYDEAACGLMVTSADGTIRRVNKTFCRWVGCEPHQLVDHAKFQDLLTIGGRIFHQTHWAPLLQIQGSVAEVKLEIARGDGQKLPMILNALRREHAGGTLHELALFLADDRSKYEHELMLARKRAEELLSNERAAQQALKLTQDELEQERAKAEDRALFAEQMMGIVSHDLRNPLSVIRLNAEILGNGELSAPRLEAFARMTRAVARADRLIVDLLDFTQARIGRGLQVDLKPVDVHALVAEGIEEMRPAFPAGMLQHIASGQGACIASADRIVQMIGNLLSNAFTYGAHGRPVIVRSTIEAQTYSLSVHNEGAPIAQALLPRIFDPMTRGGETPHAGRGVGLGLFIVREIARAHGGVVTVESAAGTGTTFTVAIPRGALDT